MSQCKCRNDKANERLILTVVTILNTLPIN